MKKDLLLFFLIGAVVLCVSRGAIANSTCELSLPGPISMTADVHEYEACNTLYNFSSYFTATLTGIPAGSSVFAGDYNGFCSDLTGYLLDGSFFGAEYQVQLYSSLDPSLPLSLKQVTSIETGNTYTIPWDKINYILNHYPTSENSWLDVQAAIWTLVHGCTPQSDPNLFDCAPERLAPLFFPYGGTSEPYGCPPNGAVDKTKVLSIVNDANNNGSGFTPAPNELFALIVDIIACSGSDQCSHPNQIIFIPGRCGCYKETAYAKGGYVFARSLKANPENLPSLKLTRQQWGWAINLTNADIGTEKTYDIWAGAGLNKTANGEKVGTLTVFWNGTNATITYTMLTGYYLEEVHIYANDLKPKKVAPGKFGYPIGGYNVGGVSNYSITVPLAVAVNDVDGVWLIAHAVVSNGMCN